MGANPLTYTELEAFERKALVTFTAWETEVLMKVDDTVLAAWAGETRATPAASPGEPVPASNVGAVKSLLRGLAAKKAALAKPPNP